MTSSPSLQPLLTFFRTHNNEIQEDFFTFLRFPSISSEEEYLPQMNACLNWLIHYLEKMGFSIEIWKTDRHPVLFATHLKAGPDKPTVLLYNHYDVQPVDPLEKWTNPPFEPVIKAGRVFARGAQDNKGQCLYVLQALKALLAKDGTLPVNVKLCIEGEEEIGSAGLQKLCKVKQKELQADHLFIIDLSIPSPVTPAITLGTRGVITFTIELTGSSTDLHSGDHGGIAINPIHALVGMLAQLHNKEGRVQIPGFYDSVVLLSSQEHQQIDFSFNPLEYETNFGAKPLGGEKAFSPLESCWTRPTCEVNGIWGGYTGPGFKTVIPAKASAKISCRLVPNQDPDTVRHQLSAFLESITPEGMQLHIDCRLGGSAAVRTSPHATAVQATAKAYEEVFQTSCKFIMSGGSIGVVNELREASGAEVVLMGMGLTEDQIHAPNEHFDLSRLEKGFLVVARTLELLGS